MALLACLIATQTACSRDTRTSDIKQCVAEVQQSASERKLSSLLDTDSAEERHDKIGSGVSDCMEKLGYRHTDGDMADERCIEDVDFNPYCYRR